MENVKSESDLEKEVRQTHSSKRMSFGECSASDTNVIGCALLKNQSSVEGTKHHCTEHRECSQSNVHNAFCHVSKIV